MDIVYEPHPVSPERKAELRAQGLKILDIRFKPKEETSIPTREDIATMKKADIAEWLEAHGADAGGKVADMRKRLTQIMFLEN